MTVYKHKIGNDIVEDGSSFLQLFLSAPMLGSRLELLQF